MYDINSKNIKKGRILPIAFIGLGAVIMIIFGVVFIGISSGTSNLDGETTSTDIIIDTDIDDGTTMYSATYEFEVDGKVYKCGSNFSSSFRPDDKPTTIYYDKSDPTKCQSEAAKSNNWIFALGFLIPAIFIIVGACLLVSSNKHAKVVLALNQTGKLVKGLPYHLEDSNIEINGRRLQQPVVDYNLNGTMLTLKGDPRYDYKASDEDGKVDLLIDEQNPKNYFIDFEINRLSGNRTEDYYIDPNAPASAPAPSVTPEPTTEPSAPKTDIPPAIEI